MQQIEGQVKRDLVSMIFETPLQETCGLLLEDGRVLTLPNHSEHPDSNFVVTKLDILNALTEHNVNTMANITFWHSHPAGGVGPSRTDLQQKMPFPYHLVLAIVDGDIVPTWY